MKKLYLSGEALRRVKEANKQLIDSENKFFEFMAIKGCGNIYLPPGLMPTGTIQQIVESKDEK